MITYRGLNTINQSKKFRMTGIELVKRDLLNHFSIRKGEKLMNPNFGSIIWGMLFEPLDDETKKLILDDVTAIVNYDPRVSVNEVLIQELGIGLRLQVSLTYLPNGQQSMMLLTFNKDTNSLSAA
jgi:phage baseplate assembly protein W